MNYKEYLDSEHWQTIRRLALERADGHCQICSSEEYLNVHHNNYDRINNEKLSDVVVLCGECHELYHSHLPQPYRNRDDEPRIRPPKPRDEIAAKYRELRREAAENGNLDNLGLAKKFMELRELEKAERLLAED